MTAKDFDETVHRLEEGDSLLVNGLVDDGVLITEDQRLKLLSWMGSKLATNVPKPSLDDIHNLSLRLANIPQRLWYWRRLSDLAVSNIIYRIATKLSHPRKLRIQRKNACLKTKSNLRSQ